MGVPYDKAILKEASKRCELNTSSLVQAVEFASLRGGFNSLEDVQPFVQESELTYNKFKDTFLFRTPLEFSLIISTCKDPLEHLNRLVNDLAMFIVLLAEDSAGRTPQEISSSYGINSFYFKNKLLPRLRTLGVPRTLNIMQQVTGLCASVARGDVVDLSRQASAMMLMSFRG
jgi:hypothetical protein